MNTTLEGVRQIIVRRFVDLQYEKMRESAKVGQESGDIAAYRTEALARLNRLPDYRALAPVFGMGHLSR